jgi:TPR repeat protein
VSPGRSASASAAPSATGVPLGEEVGRLAQSCGALPILEAAEVATATRPEQSDCLRLANLLPAATPELQSACGRGLAPACRLLGAVLLRRMTAALSVELHSRPCTTGKDDCYGHSRRIAQTPLGAGVLDEAKAQSYLRQACDAGQREACIELGIVLASTDRVTSAEVFRRACLSNSAAACAEAIYLVRATSQLVDPKLDAHAATVLATQCETGAGLACNNLGFMVERRLAPGGDEQRAASLYGQACALGEAIGCANLVFFAENHARQARALSFGSASATLAAACEQRPGEPIFCFARALALRRGYGEKAEPAKAREQLKRLCKAGSEDACAVR